MERKEFMPVHFLKKEPFTGSHKGLRFRMEKAEQTGEDGQAVTCLKVTAWPEPYGYDATPEEKKKSVCFDLSEEGIVAGVEWLNERVEMGDYR